MAITINSVEYGVTAIYSPPIYKDYLWGNVGDQLIIKITFDSPAAITGAEFFHGFNDNNTNPYEGNAAGVFTTSDNLYRSATTGDVQKWTGDLGANLAPSSPRSWVDGVVRFNSLGGTTYEIEHSFVLDPLLFFGNLNADGTQEPNYPSILAGANSFKYLFRINLRNPTIDPTPIESTETVDISAFNRKGNVGYINEYLNQGTPKYSLVSFDWDNGPNEIDGNVNTRGFGQIRSDSGGNFTATTDLKIGAYSVPSAFDPAIKLQPNYDWQFVYITAGGTPNGGGNISNFSATVNGGDPTLIDFEFTVLPNAYTENYSFLLTVSNDNANANQNNIFLRSGVSEAVIPVVDSILLLKNTGSAYGEDDFHFLPWYETDKLTGGFNHVHAFRADDILALWRVKNDMPADTTIDSFLIEFKQRVSGNIIPSESYTINLSTTTFPYELERNEQRASGNDKKHLRITENVAGEDYDFEVGFQIWRLWLEDDIVLSFSVIGSQFGQPFTREFQSPDMLLGQYDTTRNTPAEPQGLPRVPIAIEYTALDPSTAAVVATGLESVVVGFDTQIKAYWEDNNLNDLQVTLPDLVAYLGVNLDGDSQGTFRPFFSTYDAEASTPWREVAGHTVGRVKVDLPDIKTATAEAVLVWSQLVAIFGADALANRQICVTPRMDRYQSTILFNSITRVMWHHTQPNGRSITYKQNRNMVYGPKTFSCLGGIADSSDFTFKIGDTTPALNDANDIGWAAFPSINYATFILATIAGTPYIRVEYVGTITDTNTDIVSYFDYTTDAVITPSGNMTKTIPSNQVAGNDVMLYTGTETDFNTILTTSAANLYTEQRTAAELLANSNLIDYDLIPPAVWNDLPNDSLGNHLSIDYQLAGGMDSLTIGTTITEPNLELNSFATPITNKYYPVSGGGSNPQSFQNDGVNDLCFATDAAAAQYWAYENVNDGDYIITQATYRATNTTASYRAIMGTGNGTAATLMYHFSPAQDFRFGLLYSGVTGSILIASGYRMVEGVYTVTFCVRKGTNAFGNASVKFDVDNSFAVINGRYTTLSHAAASNAVYAPAPAMTQFQVNSPPNASFKGVGNIYHSAVKVSSTPISLEDCRRYANGEILAMPYAYKFDTFSAPNQFASTGLIPSADCITANHSGSLNNLFI